MNCPKRVKELNGHSLVNENYQVSNWAFGYNQGEKKFSSSTDWFHIKVEIQWKYFRYQCI